MISYRVSARQSTAAGLLQQLVYTDHGQPHPGRKSFAPPPEESKASSSLWAETHFQFSNCDGATGDHSLSSFLIHVTPTTQTNFKSSCYEYIFPHHGRIVFFTQPPLETRAREQINFILGMQKKKKKSKFRIFSLLWRVPFGSCFQALTPATQDLWQFFLFLAAQIQHLLSFYSVPTLLLGALTCYFITTTLWGR